MFTIGVWRVKRLALGKAGDCRIESRKDAKNAKVMNQKPGILSFFCFLGQFSPSFQILSIAAIPILIVISLLSPIPNSRALARIPPSQ